MIGIKRGDIEIRTMTIPERKKPCLFVATGNNMIKIGQFDNQETEKAFWTLIDYIALGNEEYRAKNCIKKLLSISLEAFAPQKANTGMETEVTGEERRTS